LKNPRQQKPRKWKWNEAATLSAFPSCLVSYLDNLIYTYAYTYIYIYVYIHHWSKWLSVTSNGDETIDP
jgi:hypothetical protein